MSGSTRSGLENERAQPFAEWLSAVRRLLRAWWYGDRICNSPHEGRLFRLRVGDVLLVEGQPVRVVERIATEESDTKEAEEENTIAVTYECRGVGEEFRLSVVRRLGSNLTLREMPAVLRINERSEISMDVADIEVFGCVRR